MFFSVSFFILSVPRVNAQNVRKTRVDFYSSDSLLITADLYLSAPEDPYILLFHQENSSRGEFESLAERFIKMRYNCLAVDMRIGDSYGYINNLTADRAGVKNVSSKKDALKDLKAAISYVGEISDKEIILFGSSLSATLVLKVAAEDDRVGAVMAFSPGEYLRPDFLLSDILASINVPAFISCSPLEYPYLLEAINDVPQETITIFEPPQGTTGRGSDLLTKKNPSNNEYWFSVLIFIKSLQV